MPNQSFAVWLTGLPGSGKSTIAEHLKKKLNENDIEVFISRMDDMRKEVTPDPKYTDEERQLIYNAFSYLAKVLVDHNINVIMDATGNLRKYRSLAKKIIDNFLEVYIECPLDVAIQRETERRDTKGAPKQIYEKALKDETKTVPGIQSEYEKPLEPALTVNSAKLNPEECSNKIFNKIQQQFY